MHQLCGRKLHLSGHNAIQQVQTRVTTCLHSVLGNHTFAALKCPESYEVISAAFQPLISNINTTIKDGKMTTKEQTYKLFFLGGDYKVYMSDIKFKQNKCIFMFLSCYW